MIDFEHAQCGEGVAVRERVETRAEHDVLGNAPFDRPREFAFRTPAARDHERPQVRRHNAHFVFAWIGLQLGGVVAPDNTQRHGVIVQLRVPLRTRLKATIGLVALVVVLGTATALILAGVALAGAQALSGL